MKIYSGAFLALCALPVAGAFNVQAPVNHNHKIVGSSSSSALKSSLQQGGPAVGAYPGGGGPQVNGVNGAGSLQNIPPRSGPPSSEAERATMQLTRNAWDNLTPILVQGGSLRTWSFATPNVDCVQVLLKTDGRPLNANVDLWQGPDNTPQKMGIYLEDGSERPFCAVIATPRSNNAVAIRNTGQMEFPLSACVEADFRDGRGSVGLSAVTQSLRDSVRAETIQGGAIKTYAFAPSVASVQVLLESDGRPLNARIELLQGPNNNKQVLELYTEDGNERPFFAVLETPGVGNVVRVLNTAPMEFPLYARVEPYLVEQYEQGVVISDEIGGGWDRR